jgi:hypothetical protein
LKPIGDWLTILPADIDELGTIQGSLSRENLKSMDKCIFCDCDLAPGGVEHVFLSALGGRVATRRATCQRCNNAFANNETGKVDDALAEVFKEIRNGLKIWSGRDGPPPTLLKAGSLPNGAEFDLAPGFVPIVRAGRLPTNITPGSEHQLIARDEADAKRLLDILAKRGISVEIGEVTRVEQKAPGVKRTVVFDGPKGWRSVAKTAAVAFVVLYGNEQARRFVSPELRKAIRYGVPPINDFAGWDFTNEWPVTLSLVSHDKTPDARPSDFEHSVIVTDVGPKCVAYITLFGGWRFSVDLGARTNLPDRGLAVNPRSAKAARFVLAVKSATAYAPRSADSFASEHAEVMAGNEAAFERALQKWSDEAHESYAEKMAAELQTELGEAGDDEAKRAAAVETFARKLASIEYGDGWATDLDLIFSEDTD